MRLKEPFVFFVDRSFGSCDVPNALRAVIVGGERVEVHDQQFAQDTNDDVWLATVGTHGWVALTKDRAIRYNPLELRALLVAKTAFFVFSGGQARGAQAGEALATGLPRMRRVLRRFHVPIIARVDSNGGVSVSWANGAKLPSPVQMK